MSLRTNLGRLARAAIAACLLMACDDSSDTKADAGDAGKQAEANKAHTEKLTERCKKLGEACGEKDKHKAKITEECTEAAKLQVEKGCSEKVVAAYDCYQKEVCVKDNKIWALDDFRVLSDRNKKCLDERKAASDCVAGVAPEKK